MNKQIVVYLYNGSLFSNKKEKVIDEYKNLEESQRCYAAWKKWISKGYILFDFIYKMCSKTVSRLSGSPKAWVEEGRRGKFLESRQLLKCTSKKKKKFFFYCMFSLKKKSKAQIFQLPISLEQNFDERFISYILPITYI